MRGDRAGPWRRRNSQGGQGRARRQKCWLWPREVEDGRWQGPCAPHPLGMAVTGPWWEVRQRVQASLLSDMFGCECRKAEWQLERTQC